MAVKRGGLGRNLDSLIPTPIRAPGVETPVAGRLEVDRSEEHTSELQSH